MTNYQIIAPQGKLQNQIKLSASKSESNRVLIIQALCEEKFTIENLSDAKDTIVLRQLLNASADVLDVGPAGTTMRFLTAFFAGQINRNILLTGSARMLERPIKPLVEALCQLGAEIVYSENEGYPPLKIVGKKLPGGEITIPANISSQFITALLLIAPTLEQGLHLRLAGKVISRSYINMTLRLLKYFGIDSEWIAETIFVPAQSYVPRSIKIEPDWSGASYFYSLAALSRGASFFISDLQRESLQGDSVIAKIMESFSVETIYGPQGIEIRRAEGELVLPDYFEYDFTDCPDLAQTVAVVCAGLNVRARLTGLESLVIKETDRIKALVTELSKAGFSLVGTDNALNIEPVATHRNSLAVETYHDHRMAMAFAPLSLCFDQLLIKDIEVVEKSYPGFWRDLLNTGFKTEEK